MTFCVSDHPVRSFKGGFATLLLEVASTPPHKASQGGDYCPHNNARGGCDLRVAHFD
jgi:hypothetical protein